MSKDDKRKGLSKFIEDTVNKRVSNIEISLSRLESKFDSLENLNKQIQDLNKAFITYKSAMDNNAASQNADVDNEKYNTLNVLREQLDNVKSEHEQAVKVLEADKETLREQLDSAKSEYEQAVKVLEADKETLREQLDSAKSEYEQAVKVLEADKKTLREQLDSAKSEHEQAVRELEADKKTLQEQLANETAARQLKEDEMCNLLKRLMRALTGKDDSATIEELEQHIESLKCSLSSEKEHSENLQKDVEAKSQEIAWLDNTVNKFSRKIEELTNTVATREETITVLNSKIDDKNKNISLLNDEISSKSSEITSLKNDIELKNVENYRLNSIISEHEKCKTEFTDAMSAFLDIFKLMQKCPSMQSVVEEQFGLPMEGELSISQQVQFANCFSDKTYCAGLVYEGMKQYKKANPEPITKDESALVKMLNDYYKDLFDIKEDILDCLSIESGAAFNHNEMKLITDPNNSFLSRVDFLCVPALRNQDSLSELAQKALIMGN